MATRAAPRASKRERQPGECAEEFSAPLGDVQVAVREPALDLEVQTQAFLLVPADDRGRPSYASITLSVGYRS